MKRLFFLLSLAAAAAHAQDSLDCELVDHFDSGHTINSVSLGDGFCFLAEGGNDSPGRVLVCDISDPGNVSQVGSWDAGGDEVLSVQVSGSLGLVSCDESFRILDLSDPMDPAELGRHTWQWATYGDPVFSWGFVYCSGRGSGIHRFDISDPSAPVESGSVGCPDGVTMIEDVALFGEYLLAGSTTGPNHGLWIYDLDLNVVTSLDVPGGVSEISVVGNIAYVVNAGLHIVDLSDPADPELLFSAEDDLYLFKGVSAQGSKVFVSGGWTESTSTILQVWDVGNVLDPSAPVLSGYYAGSSLFLPRSMARDGEFAYIPAAGEGLFVCRYEAGLTGIAVHQQSAGFTLGQNYPNPFNPSTIFPVDVLVPGNVALSVFDLLGRRVAVLQDGFLTPGRHLVPWSAAGFGSGAYFVQLQAGGQSHWQKIALLR